MSNNNQLTVPDTNTTTETRSPSPVVKLSPPSDNDSNTAISRALPPSYNPLSPTTHSQYKSLLSQLSSLQSDLENELEEEFAQPTLDVSSIKDICRYFLNEYIKVGEKWVEKQKGKIAATNSNIGSDNDAADKPITIPDAILVEMPLLSSALRIKIWKILLGCHNKDETIAERFQQEQEQNSSNITSIIDKDDHTHTNDHGNNNEVPSSPTAASIPIIQSEKKGEQPETIAQQQLIHQDVLRTRPHDPRFLSLIQAHQDLELLLTCYCRSRGVLYKQGLNEILTPLLILYKEHNQSLGSIYNIFYSLISKFLPSIFNDREFENLRCILRSFRLLLRYFDPLLALYVDEANVLPELYATPWFITLFARELHIEVLYFLWDVYLIEDDPFFHYFVALALLIQQRHALLQMDAAALPIALRKLHISSLLSLLSTARSLRAQTPTGLRQRLYEISFSIKHHHHASPIVAASSPSNEHTNHSLEMQSFYDSLLPALRIPTLEIVQQAYTDLTEEAQNNNHNNDSQQQSSGGNAMIKFIVLDIRDKQQFDAGHLPCAIHMSPSIIFDAKEKIDEIFGDKGQYGKMKGLQHFCIVGNEMRSYLSLIAKLPPHLSPVTTLPPSATAATDNEHIASQLLTAFMNIVADNNLESSESHRAYLTPQEVIETEEAERKKLAIKKMIGAAPPLAQPVTRTRGGHSPLPTVTNTPSASTQPTSAAVPPPQSAQPETSPTHSTSVPAAVPATTAPPPVIYKFPATSPLLDPYTASFVYLFQTHGFPYVSICDGGYSACHDMVLKYKQERDKLRKSSAGSLNASPSTTALVNHTNQPIELVDHQPSQCLCCHPTLYVKWREDKIKKQLEAEKRAEKERLAQEKKTREEQERKEKAAMKAQQAAEKEAKVAKAAEEKAEKDRIAKEDAEKEKQRRRDAGEIVEDTNANSGTDEANKAPAAVVATERLQSLKRWWNEKKPPTPTTTNTTTSSTITPTLSTVASSTASPARGHSPSLSFFHRKSSKDDGNHNTNTQNTDSEHPPQAATSTANTGADESTSVPAATNATTGSHPNPPVSLFSKWESQARALAKKISENTASTTSTTTSISSSITPAASHRPISPHLSEKDRMTAEHLREKQQERAESLAIDLREWMKDPQITLFSAHEVRRIPGSTQGLLIPRVLAITNGYIISLRPDNSKYATHKGDSDKDQTEHKKVPGLFERITATIAAATSSNPAVTNNNATIAPSASSSASPNKDATNKQAVPPVAAPVVSSSFSLAPSDDSSLLLEQNHHEHPSEPPTPDRGMSPQSANTNDNKSASTPTPITFSSSSSLSSSSISSTSTSSVSLIHPTNEAFSILGSGMAFIHSKRKITDLDKITSKKERPCLLTFHWKTKSMPTTPTPISSISTATNDTISRVPSPMTGVDSPSNSNGANKSMTIYVLDRPKQCIELVKRKYAEAKAATKRALIDSVTYNSSVVTLPAGEEKQAHKEEDQECTAEGDEEEDEDNEEDAGDGHNDNQHDHHNTISDDREHNMESVAELP